MQQPLLSKLGSHDWCEFSPPVFPKDSNVLRCSTFNLHGFLRYGMNNVHRDSAEYLADLIKDGGFEFVALQEMGLTGSRLSMVHRTLAKQDCHLLLASDMPQYYTCGLVTSRWWFVRHFRVWKHSSGRAMCVDFQYNKESKVRVAVVYGVSGASARLEQDQATSQILTELQEYMLVGLNSPNDALLILGDFNLPWPETVHTSRLHTLSLWASRLDVVHAGDCWAGNSGKQSYRYVSHFPIASSATSLGTCIDHIWVSSGLATGIQYFGVMCYGLLESDHALVMCDIHLWFLVGSRSNLLISLTQPIITHRVFPRSSKWSDTQWTQWASRLDDPVTVSKEFARPIASIGSDFPSSYSDGAIIRQKYDCIWEKFISFIQSAWNTTTSSSKIPSREIESAAGVKWHYMAHIRRVIGCISAFSIPSNKLSQKDQYCCLAKLGLLLWPEDQHLVLCDCAQWPEILVHLVRRHRHLRRELGRMRAKNCQQRIEMAIQRRTASFLNGDTRPLFQSFHRSLNLSNLARPFGIWCKDASGIARLINCPTEIMMSASRVYQQQCAFKVAMWGVESSVQESVILQSLLKESTKDECMQDLTRRLPLGLQPFYQHRIPDAAFQDLLPSWTVDELRQCLQQHAVWKAPGPSGAQIGHLRHLPHCVLEFLVTWFNHIQDTGIWPTAWKHAQIYPIPKTEGSAHWESMRPISLVETFVKVFTRRLLRSLHKAFQGTNFLNASQYGFVCGKGTTDPLRIVRMVYEMLSLQKQPAIINYIDLQNAYNSVPHWGLAMTLISTGLPLRCVRLMMDLDIGATAQVITPVGLSPSFALMAGVRQGEVLSPFKFLLWINPLAHWLEAGLEPDIPMLLADPTILASLPKGEANNSGTMHPQDAVQAVNSQYLMNLPLGIPLGVSIVGSILFADDIWLGNPSIVGAQVQVWKVSTFVVGFGPCIGIEKSATSWTVGVEVSCSSFPPKCLVKSNKTETGSIALPTLPPSNAYKYLGIPICVALNDSIARDVLIRKMINITKVLSRLRVSLKEITTLFVSVLGGLSRYYFQAVGVSWTQLQHWDSLVLGLFRTRYSAPRCSLSIPFWLSNCWAFSPPRSLTLIACETWISGIMKACNSPSLVGALCRYQMETLSSQQGMLHRNLASPWDRCRMAHFLIDYASAALALLGWRIISARQPSIGIRRSPEDIEVLKLIPKESARINYRLATECAKRGIYYISQLTQPDGCTMKSLVSLAWPKKDRMLYSCLRKILVDATDPHALALLPQWCVSPAGMAVPERQWEFVEAVQWEWVPLLVPHIPVFSPTFMHDIYNHGLYITDGSASVLNHCQVPRSGAAVVFISPRLEVSCARVLFRSYTPAFLTELAAITVALLHSNDVPCCLMSDCQGALKIVDKWPKAVTQFRKWTDHPVWCWISSKLNLLSARLQNHWWPLWWIKGHTQRPDWLFPLQHLADVTAGSLDIIPLLPHQVWNQSPPFLLRNEHGNLIFFSREVLGHRYANKLGETLYSQHGKKAQWYRQAVLPKPCCKWKVKWLNGIVPGPLHWPFMHAREECLSFRTRDCKPPFNSEQHACLLCDTASFDTPEHVTECPWTQQYLMKVSMEFLGLYLRHTPLCWAGAETRWQSPHFRYPFFEAGPSLVRRTCPSRAYKHHIQFLSKLPLQHVAGPLYSFLNPNEKHPSTSLQVKEALHEMEVVHWKRAIDNKVFYMQQYRFFDLWARYLRNCRTSSCDTDTRAMFVNDVTEMIERETSETAQDRACVARWDQSWACPDTLYAVLQSFGVTVEMFSSPLNYSFVMDVHFSASQKDDRFGLQFDAYNDHSSGIPVLRQWADITTNLLSPVSNTCMQVHMSIANPPYLKEDLHRLCHYASTACAASLPVRIWCILPARCKEVPDVEQLICSAGARVIAVWPAFSFSFVPLDFWLGLNIFSISRGHTAPMPILLAVFENALAETHFPITEFQVQVLQTWSRSALGLKCKEMQWFPTSANRTWWESATLYVPLLDIIMPQQQWWRKECAPPFSDISLWAAIWGNPPPALWDWLLFCGLSSQQAQHWLSDGERAGIQHMTRLWLCRISVLDSTATLPPIQKKERRNHELQCISEENVFGFTMPATSFSTSKHAIDSVTFGSTPTLAYQMGNRDFGRTVCIPFQKLIDNTARWKHLFHWIRPPETGDCCHCHTMNGYVRSGICLCRVCRIDLFHPGVNCRGLHCRFCGTSCSHQWWSVALVPVVCQVCVDELSFKNETCITQTCPVPTCQKVSGIKQGNRSIDGSRFCTEHMKRQPNCRQFTMIRLRYLLQLLSQHSGLKDSSYFSVSVLPLWHLAAPIEQGGFSDIRFPYRPWPLEKVCQALAPLTEKPEETKWQLCQEAGQST